MSDNKRSGRGMFGKGYYIALILCAAAIGISGYLYYRNANQNKESLREAEAQQTVPVNASEADIPAVATQPAGTKPNVSTAEETTPPVKRTLKTTAPVSGETVAGYAMDCLSYNETTRDWRVHNGVDLAAETGAEVKAAADGEVATVYEDDAMGTTVVIRHADGYTTKYASLAENLTVKPGDIVTMGQVIGYASDSAIVESTLGSHVHFGVTCNDVPVDPAEFLALGS